MYVRSKIPLQILQDSCSKSCKTLVWFLHARLCTVHILHGSKTCKKSCKGRLARLLQGLVRLWPLLLQYARFLSKYIRFSCKMCQILMQASLQASCKSLMYGLDRGYCLQAQLQSAAFRSSYVLGSHVAQCLPNQLRFGRDRDRGRTVPRYRLLGWARLVFCACA